MFGINMKNLKSHHIDKESQQKSAVVNSGPVCSSAPQSRTGSDENTGSVRYGHLTCASVTWSYLTELEVFRLESLLNDIVLPGSTRLSRCGGGRRCQPVQHFPNVELLHFPPNRRDAWRGGQLIKRPTINWIEKSSCCC